MNSFNSKAIVSSTAEGGPDSTESDWQLPLTFAEKRHTEAIEGDTETSYPWRMKEKVSFKLLFISKLSGLSSNEVLLEVHKSITMQVCLKATLQQRYYSHSKSHVISEGLNSLETSNEVKSSS